MSFEDELLGQMNARCTEDRRRALADGQAEAGRRHGAALAPPMLNEARRAFRGQRLRTVAVLAADERVEHKLFRRTQLHRRTYLMARGWILTIPRNFKAVEMVLTDEPEARLLIVSSSSPQPAAASGRRVISYPTSGRGKIIETWDSRGGALRPGEPCHLFEEERTSDGNSDGEPVVLLQEKGSFSEGPGAWLDSSLRTILADSARALAG